MVPAHGRFLEVSAFHKPRRSATGVTPASSPSVPLDDESGGGTPPKLAAEDGCATLRRFRVPMHVKKRMEAFQEPLSQREHDAMKILLGALFMLLTIAALEGG